jgi:hypothetical protein
MTGGNEMTGYTYAHMCQCQKETAGTAGGF